LADVGGAEGFVLGKTYFFILFFFLFPAGFYTKIQLPHLGKMQWGNNLLDPRPLSRIACPKKEISQTKNKKHKK